MTTYLADIAALATITAIALVGQQLLLFHARLLCLCASTFYALGAYGSGIIAKEAGVPIFLSVPSVALATALISLPVGWVLLRYLRSDFFALATLGLAQAAFVTQ